MMTIAEMIPQQIAAIRSRMLERVEFTDTQTGQVHRMTRQYAADLNREKVRWIEGRREEPVVVAKQLIRRIVVVKGGGR